jgi:TRAP-type C4-dicarboxylate transport system permease large subunit
MALIAFLTAALVMIVLMFGIALAVALAQEQLVSTLKARTRQVKQAGGSVLILVGIWLLVLGIWSDFFAEIFPV